MPQHKSAIKRVRQTAKVRVHNRARRSKMRTLIKKVETVSEKALAEAQLKETVSYLDKMVKAGIIHKNNAAHKKSRLTKIVNAIA